MIKPVFKENYSAIAINCSNEYVPYLSVCLKSLVDNISDNRNYDIIICEKCITEENKEKLTEYISRDNVSLRFFNISTILDTKDFPDIFKGYTIESYAILFTPLLFEEYERILFTDCDLIFNFDISELYNINLNGNMACAVRDLTMSMLLNYDEVWKTHIFEELKLSNVDDYFNSGVMVYDIQKCKENDFIQKTLEIAKEPQRIFIQGILNKYYQGKNIEYMSNTYNLDVIAKHEKFLFDKFMDEEHTKIYQKALEDVKVIHWAGIRKPWFYPDETLANLWWGIAKSSPYYSVLKKRLFAYRTKKFMKDFIQGIFSVRNDKNHKVIRIMGLKIKIRRTL